MSEGHVERVVPMDRLNEYTQLGWEVVERFEIDVMFLSNGTSRPSQYDPNLQPYEWQQREGHLNQGYGGTVNTWSSGQSMPNVHEPVKVSGVGKITMFRMKMGADNAIADAANRESNAKAEAHHARSELAEARAANSDLNRKLDEHVVKLKEAADGLKLAVEAAEKQDWRARSE